MRILLSILLFCVTAHGQVILKNAKLQNVKLEQAPASGGGANVYALLGHSMVNSPVTTPAGTSALDTTGAKLIVIMVANYNSSGADVGPTDSSGNTFIPGTVIGPTSAGTGTNQLWYCINPTTSATDVFTATRNYTVLGVQWYSCTGTPVFDSQAAGLGSDSFTTIQPGSVTPTGTGNGLFISGITYLTGPSASINSGFTKDDDQQQGSNSLFGAMAHKLSNTAENPTWTVTSGNIGATTQMAFK